MSTNYMFLSKNKNNIATFLVEKSTLSRAMDLEAPYSPKIDIFYPRKV